MSDAATWLSRLVAIPSHPSAGERVIAEVVADWFTGLGATVELGDTSLTDRPNVYAVVEGRSDRWLGLDVHLDTVGVEHCVGDPFSGEVRDGRVWGRGATDAKGMLAVALAVLEERRPEHNVLVVGTAAAGTGGFAGPAAFREWMVARGAPLDELVIAEPTGCAPAFGHKGALGIELTVRGRACHAAVPENGANAIDAAAEMILALREEHRALQAGEPTAVGLGTLTTTMITGGAARNIVPDACTVSVGRRLVPGEDVEVVRDHLIRVARDACPLPVDADGGPGLPAFYGDPDGSLCRRLAAWSGQPSGGTPQGSNAYRYDELVAGEIVVLGPGSIDQAHAPEEWCSLDQLALAADVFARWVRDDIR